MVLKKKYLVCGLAFLLSATSPSLGASQLAQQRFDGAKRAIAKIMVEGKSPEGTWRSNAGSGFFVYSKGMTFIITAAHVIGSNETEQAKNPDWLVENGTLSRKIKVSSLDAQGSLIERTDAAQPVPIPINVDIAILAIANQEGYPILSLPEQLTEKMGSHDVLLMGFQSGKNSLTPLLQTASGTLTAPTEFRTSSPSFPGESGGPWIDVESGKVFAVASGLKTEPGAPYYVATPVTYAIQALRTLYGQYGAAPTPSNTSFSVLTRRADAEVMVSGDSGDLVSRPRKMGELDEAIEVAARGAEASQCDASSGRTIAEGIARARIFSVGGNGLFFFLDLKAQGGHYRTAATCLTGLPVGLTGHDTSANSEARLKGEMEFNAPANDEIKVVWHGMPTAGASFRLIDMTTNNNVAQLSAMQGDNEQRIRIPSSGRYRLVIGVERSIRNTGACCPEQITASATATVEH